MEVQTEGIFLTSFQNLMDSMKGTTDQAMDSLKFSVDDGAKYVASL